MPIRGSLDANRAASGPFNPLRSKSATLQTEVPGTHSAGVEEVHHHHSRGTGDPAAALEEGGGIDVPAPQRQRSLGEECQRTKDTQRE